MLQKKCLMIAMLLKNSYNKKKLAFTSKDFKVENSFSTQASNRTYETKDNGNFDKLNDSDNETNEEIWSQRKPINLNLMNLRKIVKDDLELTHSRCSEKERRSIANESGQAGNRGFDDNSKKFKTELCKNYEIQGFCQWGMSVK